MAGEQTSTRARGKRDPVFVTLGQLKYGFQASSRSQAHRAVLGHVAWTGQEGVFFGVNNPKPNRAQLKTANSAIASFVDPSKEEGAIKAGWSITKTSRRRGIGQSSKTIAVSVPIVADGSVHYCWRMDLTDYNLFGKELGIVKASVTKTNVWGANQKPPRASKVVNGQRQSSFISPVQSILDKASAKGWEVGAIDFNVLPETAIA